MAFKLACFSSLRSGVVITRLRTSMTAPGNHEKNCQTFSTKFLQFNTYKEFRALNKEKKMLKSSLRH